MLTISGKCKEKKKNDSQKISEKRKHHIMSQKHHIMSSKKISLKSYIFIDTHVHTMTQQKISLKSYIYTFTYQDLAENFQQIHNDLCSNRFTEWPWLMYELRAIISYKYKPY